MTETTERTQLKRLSHRHEDILNWLISNPIEPLKTCAEFFGVTPPWLTQIIHSDLFQAKYQALCKEKNIIATHTIMSKINAVTRLALDRTAEKLSNNSASERFITDTNQQMLQSLGYLGKDRANDNSKIADTLIVTQSTINEAKERIQAKTAERTVEATFTKVVNA